MACPRQACPTLNGVSFPAPFIVLHYLWFFIALLPHEIEEERLKSQALSQDNGPNVDSAMNSASDDSEEGKWFLFLSCILNSYAPHR